MTETCDVYDTILSAIHNVFIVAQACEQMFMIRFFQLFTTIGWQVIFRLLMFMIRFFQLFTTRQEGCAWRAWCLWYDSFSYSQLLCDDSGHGLWCLWYDSFSYSQQRNQQPSWSEDVYDTILSQRVPTSYQCGGDVYDTILSAIHNLLGVMAFPKARCLWYDSFSYSQHLQSTCQERTECSWYNMSKILLNLLLSYSVESYPLSVKSNWFCKYTKYFIFSFFLIKKKSRAIFTDGTAEIYAKSKLTGSNQQILTKSRKFFPLFPYSLTIAG